MLKKIMISLSLLFCISVYAVVIVKPLQFTINNQPLVLTAQNPTVTITLPVNPTTGFAWSIQQYDTNLVKLVLQRYTPPITRLMGAPGIQQYTFAAVKTGYAVTQVGHIVLNYARPWTMVGKTTKTFVVQVQ
jgi:inhibitor of cysteine peptidase